MTAQRDRQRGSWRQRKGLVALAAIAGFSFLLFLTALFGEQGLLRVRQLEGERSNLERRIALLEEETGALRDEVHRFKKEPFAYESLARERLGLVMPGEVVYDFRTDPLSQTP